MFIDAALIITELVANAIRYARTDVEVRVQHIAGGVRLEVSDQGCGFSPDDAHADDEPRREPPHERRDEPAVLGWLHRGP